MGIWVRSQDKKLLVNTDRIFVYGKSVAIIIANGRVEQVGEYETEERALEALNEVQNHIGMMAHNHMYKCNPDEQYNYTNYIFEMPEK